MPVSLLLKWRGEELSLECPEETTMSQLAEMIFERTRVPQERQILMAPGLKLNKQTLANPQLANAPIKDTNLKFVSGSLIKGTLVGTPVGDEFILKPLDQDSQLERETETIRRLPKGYINIGNTCYLGSVLALLEQCAEFRQFLIQTETSAVSPSSIPAVLREIWKGRYRNPPFTLETPIHPAAIFKAVCLAYPEFGVRKPGSLHPQMQDAEECLSRLFQSLSDIRDASGKNLSSFFEVEFDEETTVSPAVLESLGKSSIPPEHSHTSSPKLSCYMGTMQKPVAFLLDGVSLSMEDEIERFVPALDQNALCLRKRKISRLPKYVIVHMVRFEWKKANALAGSKAGRAKVLKKVEYSKVIDLYNLCNEELQSHLRVGRLAEQAKRERELLEIKQAKAEGAEEEQTMEEPIEPKPLPCSGKYKLLAVVTHTGRSAIDGHYICWIWKGDHWIKMDDDKSSIIEPDRINLQGGLADGPCPYILLYERDGEISEETAALPGSTPAKLDGIAVPTDAAPPEVETVTASSQRRAPIQDQETAETHRVV